MEFIETYIFTKQITSLISDTEYRQLQEFLTINPEAGALIQGTGGLRKLRWNLESKGKRGGLRIIYYYYCSHNQIFFLLAYKKAIQEDLTHEQKLKLKKLVEDFKNG